MWFTSPPPVPPVPHSPPFIGEHIVGIAIVVIAGCVAVGFVLLLIKLAGATICEVLKPVLVLIKWVGIAKIVCVTLCVVSQNSIFKQVAPKVNWVVETACTRALVHVESLWDQVVTTVDKL